MKKFIVSPPHIMPHCEETHSIFCLFCRAAPQLQPGEVKGVLHFQNQFFCTFLWFCSPSEDEYFFLLSLKQSHNIF